MKPQTKNKISFLLYSYFFLIALFYPMQYVSFDSAYYTEFTFAGLFAGLLILWTVFAYHRQVRLTDPSDRRFCCWILVLLVLYNLFSLYINFTHSRWLWEQFNFSLAVLFFIVLLIHGAAFFRQEPLYYRILSGIHLRFFHKRHGHTGRKRSELLRDPFQLDLLP